MLLLLLLLLLKPSPAVPFRNVPQMVVLRAAKGAKRNDPHTKPVSGSVGKGGATRNVPPENRVGRRQDRRPRVERRHQARLGDGDSLLLHRLFIARARALRCVRIPTTEKKRTSQEKKAETMQPHRVQRLTPKLGSARGGWVGGWVMVVLAVLAVLAMAPIVCCCSCAPRGWRPGLWGPSCRTRRCSRCRCRPA